ncbi:MAG: phosphatidylserine decarboxylase family protein [Thermodesulfobacteriota bacterium]|jgi:phosphatidylserine decarboxylase
MHIPIAREGYPFIFFSLVVIIFFYILGIEMLVVISFCLAVFVISFFRDPERDIPRDNNLVVSPADGKVIKVERLQEERFLGEEAFRISIFMTIFNVHVNRVPASGRVMGVSYNPGRFFSANLDKASDENEQNAMFVEVDNRRRFVVVQIAGLIARRIVCYAKKGEYVEKGNRFGIIRFGSRLDVYLPLNCLIKVKIGDKVKAGSSVLGSWSV